MKKNWIIIFWNSIDAKQASQYPHVSIFPTLGSKFELMLTLSLAFPSPEYS